jgi:ABC-type antimicrobial peptide transport system permease subunit
MASRTMSVAIRSAPDAPPLIPAIRTEVEAMDPDLPLRFVSTMEAVVSSEMAPTRFYLSLLAGFAGLAVILAAVGLYGVVSYLVSLRRQEVGIRIALGADGTGILQMFFRQAAIPTLSGMLLGVVVALGSASTLEEFLFQVNPRDPLVFGGVLVILTGVAITATALPARAATRIAPTEAMRVE